jgi:hypothetical protein
MTPLPSTGIRVSYRNWRGETRVRALSPIGVRFGTSEWHKTPQNLLIAVDLENGVIKEFALADCNFRMEGDTNP